jgi:anti-anti-sigma regulatory factor
MLDIRMEPAATGLVWRLTGDLTSRSTSMLRVAARQVRSGRSLLVDMSGISRVDPPGLAALVALLVRARDRAGSLRVRVSPDLHRQLAEQGFDRLFPLVSSARAARPELR